MENIFCKHLDLDFNIDLTIIEQFKTQVQNKSIVFRIPSIDIGLQNFLKPLDITAQTPACFYTPPNAGRGWHHIDSLQLDNRVKLNYIVGGKNTVMQWFKFNGHEQHVLKQENELGGGYLKFYPKVCELIWEEELKSPSLINAGIPHNVKNNSNSGRWAISYPLFNLDNTATQWNQMPLWAKW
jgi:hypothetical protein